MSNINNKSFILNKRKFIFTLLISLIIITGVIFRDGGDKEQANLGLWSNIIGTFLFTSGWLLMAYIVSIDNNNQFKTGLSLWLPVISCIGLSIVLGILVPQWKKYGRRLPYFVSILPAFYVFFSILLGWSLSLGKNNDSFYFGLLAPFCILIGVMLFQPWQRGICMVDGPGFVLYTLGYIFYSFANSL
jgi:hypothetical protein